MRKLRPLLVGMTPNPRAARKLSPLYGRCTTFLSKISGLPSHVIVDEFERVNLIPYVLPDKRWPKATAKVNAMALSKESGFEHRDVFLLGRNVAEAFVEVDVPFFERFGMMVVFPHPSGLCRVWNDPVHRAVGGKMLREAHQRWKENA